MKWQDHLLQTVHMAAMQRGSIVPAWAAYLEKDNINEQGEEL